MAPLLLIAGLLALALGGCLSPEVAQRYLSPDGNIVGPGRQMLTVLRLTLSSLGLGSILLSVSSVRRWVRQNWRAVVFVWPIFLAATFVWMKLAFGAESLSYMKIVSEDGVVEYATCAVYAAAAVVALLVAVRLFGVGNARFGACYAALGFILFIVSGEEISWGQRLFGLRMSEWFQTNVQGEITFHNLSVLQPLLHPSYLAVSLLGGLMWAFLPRLRARRPEIYRQFRQWAVPPWYVSSYFLLCFAFYAIYEFTPERFHGPSVCEGFETRFGFFSIRDQEPAELLLSLGFLIFVSTRWTQARRRGTGSITPAPGSRR